MRNSYSSRTSTKSAAITILLRWDVCQLMTCSDEERRKLGLGTGLALGLYITPRCGPNSPHSRSVAAPSTRRSLATCSLDDRIRSFARCARFHVLFMFEIPASGPGLHLLSSTSKSQ